MYKFLELYKLSYQFKFYKHIDASMNELKKAAAINGKSYEHHEDYAIRVHDLYMKKLLMLKIF